MKVNSPVRWVHDRRKGKARVTEFDKPSDDPRGEELRILRALRRIIRAVDIHSRRLFASSQLTGPQLVSLLTLSERGPMTAVDLGKQIHLSPSTLVGILDRLENKGLVSRQRDLKDRRRVFLSVTEKGRSLSEAAPSPLQDRLADALKQIPSAERATLAASLERIVDLMEARHLDAAPILETGPLSPESEDPFHHE
jgi:DNA-binding MarR family transcriptional regulator